MAKPTYVAASERRFVAAESLLEGTPAAGRDLPVGDIGVFVRHPGGEDEPELMEVRYGPGVKSPPHAHEVDEILFVVEGELRFGRRVFGPGSSVYIPRLTLYSFAAGPEGLTFLNFRACRDTSVIGKEDLQARGGRTRTGG